MGNPIPPLDETAAYDRAIRHVTGLAAEASRLAEDDPRWGGIRDELAHRRATLRPQDRDGVRAALATTVADLAARLDRPR
ncbi:hypothetical protein [Nocardia niwae]|uniref:hypothetical protein n=1 Tax=Nocardia niwae TaxID=626084 RepID=UPI0033C09914